MELHFLTICDKTIWPGGGLFTLYSISCTNTFLKRPWLMVVTRQHPTFLALLIVHPLHWQNHSYTEIVWICYQNQNYIEELVYLEWIFIENMSRSRRKLTFQVNMLCHDFVFPLACRNLVLVSSDKWKCSISQCWISTCTLRTTSLFSCWFSSERD